MPKSETCHRCRQRGSKGSIGHMRLCYVCCVGLTGESKQIVRSRRVQLSMHLGSQFQGFTEWVPDFIAARYNPPAPYDRE